MSIEYKRMQQRVGTYSQFEQYKDTILPNEFISVTSGSPDTDDGSALYFKNGVKDPKLIVDGDILNAALENLDVGSDDIETAKNEILNKLGHLSDETIETQISTAKASVLNKLGTSSGTIESHISNSESEIKSYVSTAKSDVLRKLGATDTPIESLIENVKKELSSTEKTLSDKGQAVLTKLGNSSNDTIEKQIADARDSVWNKVKTAEEGLIIILENLSDEVGTSETNIKTSISIAQSELKTELLAEIESVREEFEDKHDELLEEMQKCKNDIVRAFASLSDELAVGNSTVAGEAVLITQGTITQSYTGRDTKGDETQ